MASSSAVASASASASASLLPGQNPPLYVVTPFDQAGVIVNVAAICLVVAVVSLGIRAYVRFGINSQRFAWDDGVTLIALLFHVIQSVLVYHEVNLGLGKTADVLSSKQVENIQKSIYADDFFYVISVWLTKVSLALLYARMSPARKHKLVSQALMGVFALTAVVSIFVLALRCDLSQPWIWFNKNGVTCKAPWTCWQVIAALDIATEIFLAAMAFFFVWSLQLKLSKKAAVVIAFNLRLAIIAPIATHLHYVSTAVNSTDPSLRATSFVLCKEVEIAFAIIAASIPTLRPFITATATNYGAHAEGPRNAYTANNGTGTFSLKNLTNKMRGTHSSSVNGSQIRTNNDETYNQEERALPHGARGNPTYTNVTSGRPRGGSDDSQQMIIHKDVDYNVRYDDYRAQSRTGH